MRVDMDTYSKSLFNCRKKERKKKKRKKKFQLQLSIVKCDHQTNYFCRPRTNKMYTINKDVLRDGKRKGHAHILGFIARLNNLSNCSLFSSTQVGSRSDFTRLRAITIFSSGVRVIFAEGAFILSPALGVTTERVPTRMRCVT